MTHDGFPHKALYEIPLAFLFLIFLILAVVFGFSPVRYYVNQWDSYWQSTELRKP